MTVRELMLVIPENILVHVAETTESSMFRVDLFECMSSSSVLDYYMDRVVLTVCPLLTDPQTLLITLLKKEG